jgi:hypothetical protein
MVADYVKFFKSLKPPGRNIMAAITGPAEPVVVIQETATGGQDYQPSLKPSCELKQGNTVLTEAAPAIRMKALIDGFGKDGQLSSICTDDFGPALTSLADKIVGALGGQCIRDPLLTKNAGIVCQQGNAIGGGVTCTTSCLDKADCVVEEIVGQGTTGQKSTVISRCEGDLYSNASLTDCGTQCPCWRIVKRDSSICDPSKVTPYGLEILRKGEAEKGTVAKAACLTSPYKWGSAEAGKLKICE